MLDNGEKMNFMAPSSNSFYHISLSHTHTHTHNRGLKFKNIYFYKFSFWNSWSISNSLLDILWNHKVYPIEAINLIASKINYTNKSVFLGQFLPG